ncbi:hypothetical protein F5Y16DRAFT_416428 [Xylariaceae sp. FL0255]|nr:hypothetical protein F5Y16DRAFT_416428 [Xylariaceae sp. FL0255]
MDGVSDLLVQALRRFKPQGSGATTSTNNLHGQRPPPASAREKVLPRRTYDPVARVDGTRRVAEETLLGSTSLYEFKALRDLFRPDEDVLLRTFDQFLFQYHCPAWETIAYLADSRTTAFDIIQMFEASQETLLELGHKVGLVHSIEPTTTCDDESGVLDKSHANRPQLLALWRIWAYSIVSIEGFINGQCIVDQVAWLRGAVAKPAYWTDALVKDRQWKFNARKGIFGQCNSRLQADESETSMSDMLRAWRALVAYWTRCVAYKTEPDSSVVREVEEALIHILSRPTGPVDVLRILQKEEPAFHRLYFSNAIRMVCSEGRHN